MTVADQSLSRRVAYLERRVRELELSLARQEQLWLQVTPLCGRLCQFTLNEDFGATTANYAAADLLQLDGTDTGLDVNVYDGRAQFATYINDTDGGWCIEQLDVDGERFFVVIQGDCP